jgi:hypothetical protein
MPVDACGVDRTGRERRAFGASGAVDVAVHVNGLRPGS